MYNLESIGKQLRDPDELLVITVNTVIPYLFDVPAILGYPNSFVQRFRYKNKWINNLNYVSSVSNNELAIIVVRDEQNDLQIPVRFCRIKSVDIVNDITFIEVKLAAYVKYGTDAKVDRLVRFDNVVHRLNRTVNKVPKADESDEKSFVYLLSKDTVNSIWYDKDKMFENQSGLFKEEADWQFIVDRLIEKSQYKDTNFFKILSDGNNGDEQSINIANNIDRENSKFVLKNDENYHLEILQILEQKEEDKNLIEELRKDPKSENFINWGDLNTHHKERIVNTLPYEVNINSSFDSLKIAYPKKVAVGEYDKLRFQISSEPLDRNTEGILEIVAKRPNEGSYSQPLILPFEVKPNLKSRKNRAILFVSFFLLFVMNQTLSLINLDVFEAYPWLGILKEFSEYASVLSLLVIGTMLSALIFRTDIFNFEILK